MRESKLFHLLPSSLDSYSSPSPIDSLSTTDISGRISAARRLPSSKHAEPMKRDHWVFGTGCGGLDASTQGGELEIWLAISGLYGMKKVFNSCPPDHGIHQGLYSVLST
jgi:hypothetical protein